MSLFPSLDDIETLFNFPIVSDFWERMHPLLRFLFIVSPYVALAAGVASFGLSKSMRLAFVVASTAVVWAAVSVAFFLHGWHYLAVKQMAGHFGSIFHWILLMVVSLFVLFWIAERVLTLRREMLCERWCVPYDLLARADRYHWLWRGCFSEAFVVRELWQPFRAMRMRQGDAIDYPAQRFDEWDKFVKLRLARLASCHATSA